MAAALALRADFTGAGLRALARSSRDGNQVRRLLALAAIYEGGTRSDAARLGGVGLQTVRDWVLRFNATGPDGLVDTPPPGGVPLLDEAQRRALAQIVESDPIAASHGVVRWRLIDLAQWVGRVRDRHQQADIEPGAAHDGVSQAVGAAAPSCAG